MSYRVFSIFATAISHHHHMEDALHILLEVDHRELVLQEFPMQACRLYKQQTDSGTVQLYTDSDLGGEPVNRSQAK